MSTAVEATGFFLCIASWLVTGAALANDYWKISTVSGGVIISTREYENLWHSCAENSAGIAECRDFESLLALPGHIQASRALMIMSLLLGLACLIVSLLGLKCIRIGSATQQTKAKIAVAGGILAILSGICTLIAVSWYAQRVVQDFYNPMLGGMKFELGTGLFMGWGAASLSVLGGTLLCCACQRASSGGPKGRYHGSQPQKIYTATARSEPDNKAYV
ncbi:claudin 15-like a [Lampris incognitus]|uniref:claudin 15-like a n=1 Tax=Lampris incognitus TaxID=2546036 RepID=UPI0024B5E6FF|nr:claudin 15-like a [Lampris incognitus]